MCSTTRKSAAISPSNPAICGVINRAVLTAHIADWVGEGTMCRKAPGGSRASSTGEGREMFGVAP
jgi:hypothetical protein